MLPLHPLSSVGFPWVLSRSASVDRLVCCVQRLAAGNAPRSGAAFIGVLAQHASSVLRHGGSRLAALCHDSTAGLRDRVSVTAQAAFAERQPQPGAPPIQDARAPLPQQVPRRRPLLAGAVNTLGAHAAQVLGSGNVQGPLHIVAEPPSRLSTCTVFHRNVHLHCRKSSTG